MLIIYYTFSFSPPPPFEGGGEPETSIAKPSGVAITAAEQRTIAEYNVARE